MTPMRIRTILSVSAGFSPLSTRTFEHGTPVAPFTVGVRGDWPIDAAGVQAQHLYLAFDGQRLYVASVSSSALVFIDGNGVGTSWSPLTMPAKLCFGAARLEVSCERVWPTTIIDLSSLGETDASAAITTVMRSPAIPFAEAPQPRLGDRFPDVSRSDQLQTKLLDLSRTSLLRTQKLEISESVLAALRTAPPSDSERDASSADSGAPGEAATTFGSAPAYGDGTPLAPTTAPQYQPAPVPTKVLSVPASLLSTLCDGGALRDRATQLAASTPVGSTPIAVQGATPAHGVATALPETDARAEHTEPPREAEGDPANEIRVAGKNSGFLRLIAVMLRRLLATFRGRSPIGKLALVLLPFAAIGVGAMHGNAEALSTGNAVAPRSRPHASPAPLPTASSSPTVSESPAPSAGLEAPQDIGQSAAASTVNATASDATERAAFSAAFSGNRSDAALLYDRLATTRNARVFALAARLTREDRVRKP